METDRALLADVIRTAVHALDEVAKELESLGRVPSEVRRSIQDLREIEYRILSEPEPGRQLII